jgi:hypothetical protein
MTDEYTGAIVLFPPYHDLREYRLTMSELYGPIIHNNNRSYQTNHTQKKVDKLVIKYKSIDEDVNCVVTFEPINVYDKYLHCNTCKKYFSFDIKKSWIDIHHNCPHCRSDFNYDWVYCNLDMKKYNKYLLHCFLIMMNWEYNYWVLYHTHYTLKKNFLPVFKQLSL